MPIPYGGQGLGNVLRLASLKNVSGRRVMPGEEVTEEIEDVAPDLGGTAQDVPNLAGLKSSGIGDNIPQADLGGELTPQSYDVRANSTPGEEQRGGQGAGEQDPGFWSKVGSGLANYLQQKKGELSFQGKPEDAMQPPMANQTPPVETAEVDVSEGLPPVTAAGEAESAEGDNEGIFSRMGRSLKESFTPKLTGEFKERFPEAARQTPQFKEELDQQALNKAREAPWENVAYGSTDAFANKPELVQEFQTYTGINFDKEKEELTKKYERVLSDMDKGIMDVDKTYDEQSARIKERILNNQATDADKFYVGLALLMPLLVGGIFGKEAGIAALGGGAGGLADVLGKREEGIRKDEELLTDIYNKKNQNLAKQGELELEKLKIPATVKSAMPKDEYEDLKGMDIYQFKDPKTGEVVASGPEILEDLYADLKYANTEKKREKLSEKAKDLNDDKAAIMEANKITKQIIEGANQLEDPGILGKILAVSLSYDEKDALKKIANINAPDIFVEGRWQNSSNFLNRKIELLKDAYRRNEQMRAFTNTVASHIGDMVSNPRYTGLKSEDLIDQVLGLRDRAQGFFVERASGQGFLRAPLENKFGKLNRELYEPLNKKSSTAEREKIKEELI